MANPAVCYGAGSGPVSFDVLNTEKLTMRFTHEDGIRPKPPTGPGTDESPSLSTQSALIESRLFRERLTFTAEIGQSLLKDRAGEIHLGSQNNKAWKAHLAGREGRFSWGLSTRHMGPGYMSFSNPLAGAPRSRCDLDSTIDLGRSVLSMSALRKRDYLYESEINPVVETNQGAIRYAYTLIPGAAKLLTGYAISSTEPIQAPTPGPFDRNTSQTITLGTAFTQPKWSLVPTYTYMKTHQTSSTVESDSDTSVLKISSEFRPFDAVCFTPQFSFSNTYRSDTGAQSFTRQSALNSRLKLVPGTIELTTTLSHLAKWNQEGSIDSDTVMAGGRIDCALGRHMPAPAEGAFSIGAHLKRIKDRAGDTIQNEWEARASLTVKPRIALLGAGPAIGPSYR